MIVPVTILHEQSALVSPRNVFVGDENFKEDGFSTLNKTRCLLVSLGVSCCGCCVYLYDLYSGISSECRLADIILSHL